MTRLRFQVQVLGAAWLAAGILHAAAVPAAPEAAGEAWLPQRLEWYQDLKFGFMMHWGAYSQWGCIESWPLVEEDKWARPDNLAAWTERGASWDRIRSRGGIGGGPAP